MKKKLILTTVVLLILVFLYWIQADLFRTGSTKAGEPVTILESATPVRISWAQVVEDRLQAVIENNSDVPVTLIIASYSCNNNEPHEIIFAQEYLEDEKQYIPVSIPINRSKSFEVQAPSIAEGGEGCKIEVKHWSKYGVEE